MGVQKLSFVTSPKISDISRFAPSSLTMHMTVAFSDPVYQRSSMLKNIIFFLKVYMSENNDYQLNLHQ